jgi:tRNA(fMet)-specific endonuclease VapC
VAHGYDLLRRVLETFSNFNVMPFDLQAANEFEALRAAHVRISTMDLRIASIALTRSLIVVTRNLVDFQRVPGLQCEDWTS